MKRKTKEECETELVEHILKIGLEGHSEIDECGKTYYEFRLSNGEFRYWTNMSEHNLQRILNTSKTKELTPKSFIERMTEDKERFAKGVTLNACPGDLVDGADRISTKDCDPKVSDCVKCWIKALES